MSKKKLIIIITSVLVGLSLIGLGLFLYLKHKYANVNIDPGNGDSGDSPSPSPSPGDDSLKKYNLPPGFYVLKNFGLSDGLFLTGVNQDRDITPTFSKAGWISRCANNNMCYWYINTIEYNGKKYLTLQNVGNSHYISFKASIDKQKNRVTSVDFLSQNDFDSLIKSGDSKITNSLFELYHGKSEKTGKYIFTIKLYGEITTYLFSELTDTGYKLKFNSNSDTINKIALLKDGNFQWQFDNAYNYGLGEESKLGGCPFNFYKNVCSPSSLECEKMISEAGEEPTGKCVDSDYVLNFKNSENNIINYDDGALGNYIPMTKEECLIYSTFHKNSNWEWIDKSDIDDKLNRVINRINNINIIGDRSTKKIYDIDENQGVCVFTNCQNTKSANLFKENTICQITNNIPEDTSSPSEINDKYSYYICTENKFFENTNKLSKTQNIENPQVTKLSRSSTIDCDYTVEDSPSFENISNYELSNMFNCVKPCKDIQPSGSGSFKSNYICSENDTYYYNNLKSKSRHKLECNKNKPYLFGDPEIYSKTTNGEPVNPSRFWKASEVGEIYDLCNSNHQCMGDLICLPTFKQDLINSQCLINSYSENVYGICSPINGSIYGFEGICQSPQNPKTINLLNNFIKAVGQNNVDVYNDQNFQQGLIYTLFTPEKQFKFYVELETLQETLQETLFYIKIKGYQGEIDFDCNKDKTTDCDDCKDVENNYLYLFIDGCGKPYKYGGVIEGAFNVFESESFGDSPFSIQGSFPPINSSSSDNKSNNRKILFDWLSKWAPYNRKLTYINCKNPPLTPFV